MLLAVLRLGSILSQTKVAIWDTDDMVVEDINARYLWERQDNGVIHIENTYKLPKVVEVEDSYGVNNAILVPFKNPVILGCGDIWYKTYVWNAFSGRMFDIRVAPVQIIVGESFYIFRYGDLKEALFISKPTEGIAQYSNVRGDEGIKMSREEFMRKVTLGLL